MTHPFPNRRSSEPASPHLALQSKATAQHHLKIRGLATDDKGLLLPSSIIRIGYIDEKYFSGKAGAESHIQRLHFDITPSLDILLEPIAQGNCDMLGSQRGDRKSTRLNSSH